MSTTVARNCRRGILFIGGLMTLLMTVLLLATWRDDHEIDTHLARASAEIIEVKGGRTTISFYTPDGHDHDPELGVWYPTGVYPGDFVDVEYSSRYPDKYVRIAGRDTRLALVPITSVVVLTWCIVAALLVFLRFFSQRPTFMA